MKRLSILLIMITFSLTFGREGLAQEQLTPTLSPAPASTNDLTASPTTFQYKFTEDGQRITNQGEISTQRYIIGGILGTFPGFGIGHLIQGRYLERGWIFTTGEMGSVAVVSVVSLKCLVEVMGAGLSGETPCGGGDVGLIMLGIVGYLGFMVGEIIDVWGGPEKINWESRNLRERPGSSSINVVILPGKDMTLVGLSWTFVQD